MVMMENYNLDAKRSLRRKIEEFHKYYLNCEEKRVETRYMLEEYIMEYLSMAHHSEKFQTDLAYIILKLSAKRKKDFSGYRAANGFNAIHTYAFNILLQPWRREYYVIKTYSGFYKHQIEANVLGAEQIFQAMGYREDENGVLILDEPVDIDKIASVSLDCLVAYVECQIVRTIWEEVSALDISWLDILEFRKQHACTLQEAIDVFKDVGKYNTYPAPSIPVTQQNLVTTHTNQISQTLPAHLSQQNMLPAHGNHMPIHGNHIYQQMPSHNNHIPYPMPPQNHYSQPLLHNNQMCMAQAQCSCLAGNNYQTYSQPSPADWMIMLSPPFVTPQFNSNGYYYTNGYSQPPQSHTYSVPNPKQPPPLIDFGPNVEEMSKPSHSKHRIIEKTSPIENKKMQSPQYRESKKVDPQVYQNMKTAIPTADEVDEGSQSEDWGYVYRDLESQGYCKDLGERGDILSPLSNDRKNRKVKVTNLEDAVHSLALVDHPMKITEALEKFEKQKAKTSEIKTEVRSQGSSYENITVQEVLKKQIIPKLSVSLQSSKPKPVGKDHHITTKELLPHIVLQSKTIEVKKMRDEEQRKMNEITVVESEPSKNGSKWHCKACTYLNDSKKDICEMCSKTRANSVTDIMEIGGAECSKCTLVNPKETKICQACGASLKDSPTYI